METTKKFAISSTGEDTGRAYAGTFTVKTVLSRGERFEADRRRRDILGANGVEALPNLQVEAFKLGQLSVRIVEGPDWWKDSSAGQNLEDGNVIDELYELAKKSEEEARAEVQKEAKAALKSLAEKA